MITHPVDIYRPTETTRSERYRDA